MNVHGGTVGIIENPAANQLPEVGSLPDGFVESSVDSIAPATPTPDQEKPLAEYKNDSFSNVDHSPDSETELFGELDTSEGGTEMEQEGSFPMPMAEKYGFDDSAGAVDKPGKDCSQRREVTHDVSDIPGSVSGASVRVSGCSSAEEVVQGQCQSSQRPAEGGPNTQSANQESSESTETPKGRKLETSEVKRKNAKRTFKSEMEFLEFTMKYQQVVSERDAAIAVRDKLESLCRELQRQNKILMDECKRASTEGQNLRLDLSNKFQDAIRDVSDKLEEQKDECLSQLKENEMLRNKLKQFADQYVLSEQQFAQKLKQKSLELQIADLKIKQHEEKLIQEQSQIKLYAEQVSQLLATEKTLRLQLTADGEKFQQFQDALLKSNEVFETFKQEIEKMSKSIKELKKENTFLKSKCEKSDVTLIELVEERERLKKQLEKTKTQKEKLESLCRSLQAERKQTCAGINNSDSVPM